MNFEQELLLQLRRIADALERSNQLYINGTKEEELDEDFSKELVRKLEKED